MTQVASVVKNERRQPRMGLPVAVGMNRMSHVRPAAFAGRWYPDRPERLGAEVDGLLARASEGPAAIVGLVSPHAGMMYSGRVAAFGYRAVAGRTYECVVLVGPSHYVAFDGVAVSGHDAFACPLGALQVDREAVGQLADQRSLVFEDRRVHEREHSLELQLPFLARVLPQVPIVPLLMGRQDRGTCDLLSTMLEAVMRDRSVLFIASSDLSHYHDRITARRHDGVVLRHVSSFDPDGLQASLEAFDGHACGGGPMVVAMRSAAAHGARAGRVLQYGDSGDVSGDVDQVVGYLSAAFVSDDGHSTGGRTG